MAEDRKQDCRDRVGTGRVGISFLKKHWSWVVQTACSLCKFYSVSQCGHERIYFAIVFRRHRRRAIFGPVGPLHVVRNRTCELSPSIVPRARRYAARSRAVVVRAAADAVRSFQSALAHGSASRPTGSRRITVAPGTARVPVSVAVPVSITVSAVPPLSPRGRRRRPNQFGLVVQIAVVV